MDFVLFSQKIIIYRHSIFLIMINQAKSIKRKYFISLLPRVNFSVNLVKCKMLKCLQRKSSILAIRNEMEK